MEHSHWNTGNPNREAAGKRVQFTHKGRQQTGTLVLAMSDDHGATPAWLVRHDDGGSSVFNGQQWRFLPVLPDAAYRAVQRPGQDGRVFLQLC